MDKNEILKKLAEIKDFCTEQFFMEEQSDCVGFVCEKTDQWIVNPFMDTTGRFEVIPTEEYSEQELESFLEAYDRKCRNQKNK